jgi:L-lactate dehydrogenase complex protein LldE
MNVKAQLMVTCIVDTLYPQVGEAVVRVLEKAGVEVDFPAGQTCCGQPAFNAGMRAQARQMAQHTIRVFEATSGRVVIPSGSCTAMIRHGYQELFADDSQWLDRATTLGERCFEFTEFLVDVLGITDMQVNYPITFTYHSSCHLLRDLSVNTQPKALLNNLEGGAFVELTGADECCGFGGVFSVEHPEISTAMMERKIANIEASGASVVVSCDAGCITNINGGLRRGNKSQRAIHIAEILDPKVDNTENNKTYGQ